ncbi:hypothetical protein HMPREF3214_00139 [Alloscardovia omnicolens]|uniref:hypothetical protein n=1 Tax=Alloscardovia omnicolens TaxID=419015 RepID=UPI0007640B9D|nr:hypothetical protein [Alloscardovia omnicolens]KWZ75944.1 hypothetical protein HMPREF3214_00139 [Alloscardovia omnicolens]
MNFNTGDIILNRFRLVKLLRDEPGISVWRTHDNSLQRECHMFLVSNSAIISRVNTAASTLALSQDPRFVPVLHLHREGEVCVIVTDEDSGTTLRDYLTDHVSSAENSPLSFQAIRSIIADVTAICQDLDEHQQAHYCLDDLTVRLTTDGVQLANFPVSAALLPPTAPRFRSTNHDVESVMVYQIGALAFQMLTGTPYRSVLATRGRAMLREMNIPNDLMLICERSLCLPDNNGRTPVPLVTLLELNILLDSSRPLKELINSPDHADINLENSVESAASITQAVFKHVEPSAIADIPDSLKDSDSKKSADEHPEWSASELIFGGSKSVDVTHPDTSTDLFHALCELDEHNLDRHYDPYDFNDFANEDTETAGLRTLEIRAAAAQSNVSRETLDSVDTDFSTQTQILPPVFEPHRAQQEQTEQQESQRSQWALRAGKAESQSGENSGSKAESKAQPLPAKLLAQLFQSHIASFITIAVILIALVAIAFYSLSVGTVSPGTADDPWTQIQHEKVRFPGQDSSDTASENSSQSTKKPSEKDAAQDKATQKKSEKKSEQKKSTAQKAQKKTQKGKGATQDSAIKAVELPKNKKVNSLPTPAGTTNTTPITPRGYTFLNRPNGMRAWGYDFAFNQPSTFWKLEIGNAAGGGQVHVYADPDPSSNLPTSGTEIAHFSFADNGQVSTVILKKPVTASRLVVWIDGSDATSLPKIIKLTHYAFY